MKIVTSWDDGDHLNLKMADILEKYSIPAIFFIPMEAEMPERHLSVKEIYELGQRFTIGGHTFHHVHLASCSLSDAKEEIETGKRALQDIIQQNIDKFCFPFGSYNQQTIELVRNAGFSSARDVRLINFKKSQTDSFVYSPNFHVYPHSLTIDLAHCLKQRDYFSLIRRMKTFQISHLELPEKATSLFSGETVHLWGHTWEIEKFGLWGKLEEILKYFSGADSKNSE